MEAWFLVMLLTRNGASVPVQVPVSGYERCMAQGRYAETAVEKLKDVKVVWSCQPSRGIAPTTGP